MVVQVEWSYRNCTSRCTLLLAKQGEVVMTSGGDNVTRFSVNASNLVISDVTMSDAGLYLCTQDDGFGTKHPIILSVFSDGKNLELVLQATQISLTNRATHLC